MSSSTEICNLALSHLGVGKEISSIDTDRSQEGNACRRFYEITREQSLRDFAWPFTRKYELLGLVEEEPTAEWLFSYRYPSDCLQARRILSGIRNDNRQSRVPYLITQDSAGRLIFTDMEDACLEYTLNLVDVSLWPPDFIMAMSFLLAARIAPRVTGADPFKMGDRALQLYLFEIRNAKGKSRNEEQDEEIPQAETIRGRE